MDRKYTHETKNDVIFDQPQKSIKPKVKLEFISNRTFHMNKVN